MGDAPDPGTAEGTAATAAKPSRRQRREDRAAAKAARRAARRDAAEGTPGDDPGALPEGPRARSELPGQLRALLVAGHPRQSVLSALVIGVAALVSGRPLREAPVAAAAVLV